MSTRQAVATRGAPDQRVHARTRLLSGIDVTERRIDLEGITTAVIEGGKGPPMILLHGPGGNGTHWLRVMPDLITGFRVIAPDVPGQGESGSTASRLDAPGVLRWLAALIDRTTDAPPILVGFALGGGIAARFAAEYSDRISRLVLVNALGLAPFQPTPEFGSALNAFMAQPDEETHDLLWQQCANNFDRLRAGMGDKWDPFKAYNLDRARTTSLMSALGRLMADFAMEAIPAEDLARIAVPTTLIWGRSDRATPLAVAETASRRYGWPLHVIENSGDDPALEQPDAFVRALRE